MNDIRQTEFCCAIYELGELGIYQDAVAEHKLEIDRHTSAPFYHAKPKPIPKATEWWDAEIKSILNEAKGLGSNHLPKMIIFADVAGDRSQALPWARALRRRGYKVTKVDLGRNPKSGNDVEMFLWYTDKKVA